MSAITTPPLLARALVIDESNLSRSVMASLLREMGFTVTQASRPHDAMRALTSGMPYEVILCEYHFAPRGQHVMTGQEWLDELRQSRLIPLTTAVIMVTGEARYQCVADSVENALDDYLLKPFTPGDLQNRMAQVRRRKKALEAVYSACEKEDYELAARLAEDIFHLNGPHRLAAARMGAELFLRLGNHDAAQRLLQAVVQAKAVPWARLGLAQVELATNNSRKANRALESLISDEPGYSDAYDLLGRAQIEELQFGKALATYANAVELTPGNVSRLQKLGNLQQLMGEPENAFKHLEAAMALGSNSPTLDFQSLFQYCLAGFDLGKPRVWDRPARMLGDALRKFPQSYRLQRLREMVGVLEHLEQRSYPKAISTLKGLLTDVLEPQFDFEMGCNVIQLLTRIERSDVRLTDAADTIKVVGERFSVSRPAVELLVLSARLVPEFEEVIRSAFERMNQLSRRAMWHSLQGDGMKTVQELLAATQLSRNAKFLSLARASLQKNRTNLSEQTHSNLASEIERLQALYCGYGTHATSGMRVKPALKASASA